jgi:GNAT superfamily N-acetyltransferase
MPELQMRPFSIDTWPDFVSLMKTDAQCADCWCLNHRQAPGCPTGVAAQNEMKKRTIEEKVSGLLGYLAGECVGWIAIDPMLELIGHDCHETGKSDEWAIHCMFVKAGFRGQGISTRLIAAAVDYGRAKGVRIISAFPIPEESRHRFPVNEAEFSGRISTYLKLGFQPVGGFSDFYQRLELPC